MRQHRSFLVLVVTGLILALVIPTPGSADHELPVRTPEPFTDARAPIHVATRATPVRIVTRPAPTPTPSQDIVCFDLSTLDEVPAGLRGSSDILCVDMSQWGGDVPNADAVLERLGRGERVGRQALQDFRTEFLDLLDMVEDLSKELPSDYEGLADLRASLETERARVSNLTDDQLQVLQSAYADFDTFEASVRSVKSQVLAVKADSMEGHDGVGPAAIFPTPTPVTTPTPGIVHDRDVHDAVNNAANTDHGGLYPPDLWPDLWDNAEVGCPHDGYPSELIGTMMGLIDAAKLAEIITKAICDSKTVTCPGSNVYDAIDCVPNAVAAGFTFGLETLKEGFDFCNGNIQSAIIEALYHDTEILHAHLYDHDQNLTTRFNELDKFIFDFRNLNLRLNIEANLASPNDDPQARYALPRSVCISPGLEALQQSDPFAEEVIAGCGLLEVVSDTVRSSIDMTINAGEGVNDAEAEFAAAVAHYNRGDWRLAYDRFRKAYRETVRP
jgi:hypothetical protein